MGQGKRRLSEGLETAWWVNCWRVSRFIFVIYFPRSWDYAFSVQPSPIGFLGEDSFGEILAGELECHCFGLAWWKFAEMLVQLDRMSRSGELLVCLVFRILYLLAAGIVERFDVQCADWQSLCV